MIIVNDLTVSYKNKTVLNHFSYTFYTHQITTLYGPSGCGKTTLLNAMSGLVKYKGDIQLPGKISYIFQEDRLLEWKTVYENVAYVLKDVFTEMVMKERIEHYLTMVGLIDVKDDYPSTLSGGMRRRVSVARAFAYPSEVLLMDEPFKGMDKILKEQIMKDFLVLWEEDKRTVILVTHEEEEAKFMSHKILYLKNCPMEIMNEK